MENLWKIMIFFAGSPFNKLFSISGMVPLIEEGWMNHGSAEKTNKICQKLINFSNLDISPRITFYMKITNFFIWTQIENC